jgi:dsRNA-specific ribonuclease
MSRRSDMRRMDSPYGIPSSEILYDKTSKETRTYRGEQKGERFGEPYRSDRSSTKVYDREDRRGEKRDERRDEKRDERRDERRSRSPRRREGERERTTGERTGERTQRKPEQRERQDVYQSPKRQSLKSVRFESKEEEEDFANLNKQVVISQDDLKTIRKNINQLLDTPFTLVEAVVNPSHESSVFLADAKNISNLVTFIGKNDPELIQTLEKYPNIRIIEDNFVYTPPEVKNPFVLFFYPYWLMNMDQKTAQNVYFKNIPFQSGTFDDILRIEQPEYFVFLIPKDVKVPSEYGNIKEVDLNRGKLVIIESTKESKVPMFGKSKRVDMDATKDDWDKNFLKFLKSLLSPLAKEETIQKIVNQKTLPMWKKAFTHDTVDLNDNYEQLETIGDRVLELVFLKYLLRNYPELTPQEITELKSKYMSKYYQGTTSRKLGLGDWIRVGNDVSSISILEDVFESFFGALFEISDNEIGDGVGYVMALKFLTMIFSDVEFDLSKSQGHPRSQIKEILEMLKFDPEITDISISGKGTNVTIKISDRTHNDLVELGMMDKNSSNVIGVGFGNFKNNAINLAYSNALEYLERLGITRKWAENQKELADLLIPELEPYLDNALKRMEDEGYTRIYLRTSRTSAQAGSVVVQLVGVYYDEQKQKEQRKILESGKYNEMQAVKQGGKDIQTGKVDVIKTGKIDVVRKYAQGIKQ